MQHIEIYVCLYVSFGLLDEEHNFILYFFTLTKVTVARLT